MHENIQQLREAKGVGIQQFANLMGISKLDALSIEADEKYGIIDGPTRYKALSILNDPTLVAEPVDIDDPATASNLWHLGAAHELENDAARHELTHRLASNGAL